MMVTNTEEQNISQSTASTEVNWKSLRYDSLSEGGHSSDSGQSPVSEDQGSLVQAAQSCELDQTMTEKRKMQMWIQ